MNKTPPAIFSHLGSMHLERAEPAKTPMSVAEIKASEAARKMRRGDLALAENRRTLSWVLSPSSARNIVVKVAQKRVQFTNPILTFARIHFQFVVLVAAPVFILRFRKWNEVEVR